MSPTVLCFDCGGTFTVEYGVANPTEQCPKCNTEELTPELERYLKRYFKRTGIFRVYRIFRPGSGEKSQLQLEFVIRGRVLGTLSLWKRKSNLFGRE